MIAYKLETDLKACQTRGLTFGGVEMHNGMWAPSPALSDPFSVPQTPSTPFAPGTPNQEWNG